MDDPARGAVAPESGAAADPAATAAGLARAVAAASLGGALTGLLVGGVLGRLAMRLLAVSSPAAQGGITDDEAVVGTVSLSGSVGLAQFCLEGGAIGGLVLLLFRRVLPGSRGGRALGSAVLAGAVGGAAFVHGHGSFDFTVLAPVWFAVVVFVALPALFGLVTPFATDTAATWTRRAPLWLVVPLGVVVLVQPPVAGLAVLGYAVALLVATTRARRWWDGRAVTVGGTALLALGVAWGGYGLVVDVVSLVTGQAPTAPLNP